ncbi:hypothetical protein KCU95_g4790, partial [Aureobasidium melanogenum]
MYPFDPRSIARSNAERTSGQHQQCEAEWMLRLDPHLSNDQLRSWTDVAEELPEELKALRATTVKHKDWQGLCASLLSIIVLEPALQALRDTPQPLSPAPAPLIQALINARDFRPSAAQQSHEEPRTTAEEPRQQAEQSEEHADEPYTTAEDAPEQDEPDQQSSKHTDEDDEQTPEQNEELDQRDEEETSEQNEELNQQSPEHTDGDDDETPPLDFTHGKKRRRQIPSSNFDSSELETTSAAPAATTSTSSTVNQGTVAPIITFRSAAPATSVVSTKAITHRAANNHAGTSGMVYSCPVANCEQTSNEACTINRFYK